MNSLGEKPENQDNSGFRGLSPNTQRLILEHVKPEFEGVPFHKLPVDEMRRLREVFRGKSFSDAMFADPQEALKHIRGVLSQEIKLRTPNPQELASYMGNLIPGMDSDDIQNNLELLGKLSRPK